MKTKQNTKIDQTIFIILSLISIYFAYIHFDRDHLMRKNFAMFLHSACRNAKYANKIERFRVDDDKVNWKVTFENYKPVHYESPEILSRPPYADPPMDDLTFHPKFNQFDNGVNRVSHLGAYEIVDGRPQNPFGRTGISSRGVLGKWGPNHAGDTIVSTWKRDFNGEIVHHDETNQPILKILCITRRDTGETAVPGGMVDPGEKVSATIKREFIEEVLNGKVEATELDEFFSHGHEIYKGYVDDPRNTDNAWMETVAVNFHDESGEFLNKLKFEAGDDAVGVHFIDVDKSVKMYASHRIFIEETAKLRKSHF